MEGGSIIGTRNIQSHLSLQWKQKIGRRFLRIISFNPIEFSHAAEFRNTKVSEHKSITSAKVEEDDMLFRSGFRRWDSEAPCCFA